MRVTGFGPLITDSLGAIHAYITGLILRPPSPTALYSSLPPVQHDAERRLCTQSAGSPPEPAKDTGSVYGREQLLPEPEYPVRRKNIRELREIVEEGRASCCFAKVQEFYEQTFSSLVELNALFKENPNQDDAKLEDPEIKIDLLHAVYDTLEELLT